MESLINQLGSDRITSRQIDELVGLARGIAADGDLNQTEVEFLQKWLAANRCCQSNANLSPPGAVRAGGVIVSWRASSTRPMQPIFGL